MSGQNSLSMMVMVSYPDIGDPQHSGRIAQTYRPLARDR